jgi:hypothetical protein
MEVPAAAAADDLDWEKNSQRTQILKLLLINMALRWILLRWNHESQLMHCVTLESDNL